MYLEQRLLYPDDQSWLILSYYLEYKNISLLEMDSKSCHWTFYYVLECAIICQKSTEADNIDPIDVGSC